ncbi:V-type ATPase, V0 complex, 116kDa subunit family [Vararia minispora EC-137]|uniref:V-type ATPase, V0 complex, 116kDa subunit family n=1 Tax=Vararia minispora EC-137 TaxID=1314806 RepID=A0ACB8QUI7_9AGAM|nr:V-type ATPase, V0 complex, 116kDa subunit family [Vararia minispora EC-137]
MPGDAVFTEYPTLFCSEAMILVRVYIPTEQAHDTVVNLGMLRVIQFVDLNRNVSPFQRSFVGELRRLDQMKRIVRNFASQIAKDKGPISVRSLGTSPPFVITGALARQRFDELEITLREHDARLSRMTTNYESLSTRLDELLEIRSAIIESTVLFSRLEIRPSFDESSAPLLQQDDHENQLYPTDTHTAVDFIAGTIDRQRFPTLERLLWRLLRGNLHIAHTSIREPLVDAATGQTILKDVFIVFSHGSGLLSRARKATESMGGSIVPLDLDENKRMRALHAINGRIEELQAVLHSTASTRRSELAIIADSIRTWEDVIFREKLVHKALNLFRYDRRRKTLVAEGWCPRRDVSRARDTLRAVGETACSLVSPFLHELVTTKQPPTFHRTNKFTGGFQSIMDAYDTASYQEVNPGLFAVITFPFLFAVMFGDIGHGVILALMALPLVLYEDKIAELTLDDTVTPFFHGRYVILLMGIFSIYTGFIYNDIFSKTLHIFSSGWIAPSNGSGFVELVRNGRVYPFGLDPAWHGADNALVFLNSLKMKMAIVIGVAHMTFALCLQIWNHLRFNRRTDIYTQFLPQMLFFQSIFGYLCVCILYKWSVDWNAAGRSPPSLLNMLINTRFYPGQGFVQVTLLVIAFACVPWMLCAKPFLIWWERRKVNGPSYSVLDSNQSHVDANDEEEVPEQEDSDAVPDGVGEDKGFDDVLIHNAIHTIEFCLSCVSHTASYLRLWALSLAHSMLSAVLWDLTIGRQSVASAGGITGTIARAVVILGWFGITVGGLVMTEGLSTFLHAMRLHWVEANDKHFEGRGKPFRPFQLASDDDDY